MPKAVSKRQARGELNFSPRRRGLGNGPELSGVHEAVGGAPIRVVERVERLGAKLEAALFANRKGADEGDIECLHPGSVDGVAPHVTEGVSGRRGERGRVEPHARTVRSRAENGIAG